MLTLFSAPKAFSGHIGLIQANAIRSWLALGPQVEVILVGDDPGVREAAASFAVAHLGGVRRADSGAPSLRAVFDAARAASHHPVLGYVNSDILLLDDFLPAVQQVRRLPRFLMAGQRWDLDVRDPLTIAPGWQEALRRRLSEGRLHRPVGSDYFVFPADQYPDLPDFTIGRAGWDNWMIYDARHRRIPVVDASQVVTVIHQNHDYAHLPGGVAHHRHPESQRNVAIAGGREVIFRLEDADWRLAPSGPLPKGVIEFRYPRRLEASLIARFGPGRKARLTRLILRPIDTLRFWLGLPPRRKRGKPGVGQASARGAGGPP
jgi:hypothetical protein